MKKKNPWVNPRAPKLKRISLATLGVTLGAIATCVSPARSQASSWYWEIGGGLGKIAGGEALFDRSGAEGSSAALGAAANGGVYFNPLHGRPLEPQFGIQTRANFGSSDSTRLFMIAPYFIARLQASRLFVGAGFAPMVWRRAADDSGIADASRATGTMNFCAEGGVLWPITPDLSLGATAGAQFGLNSGTRSPDPAWDIGAMMRFYFGVSDPSGVGSRSSEFTGWRYPFGDFRNE